MAGYTIVRLVLLLLLAASFLGILIWIFRPKSKEKYDEYSKIPLKNDEEKKQ